LSETEISTVEGLQTIPAEYRALVLPLARRGDQEVANSKRVKAITTSWSRQANFIRFMKRVGQDPCTRDPALRSLLVSYCRLTIEGTNIRNKDSIRTATVSGYMGEINTLFE
jgi:hypothetical protein